MEKISGFTDDEIEILELFLEKNKSVREIESLKNGYGRTKIANIINRFRDISDENSNRVLIARHNKKNHKQVTSVTETKTEPLTEEQVEKAYKRIIIDGVTLTEMAATLGKNRETIKKAIIEFLDNRTDIEEFKKVLTENQRSLTVAEKRKDFLELNEEERKKRIFRRLNTRRVAQGKEPYAEDLLERKYNRLVDYLYEIRNGNVENEEDELSIEDIHCMMYEFPTILAFSLSNKLKPIIDALDKEYLGYSKTSKVLKDNPSILGTAISRIKLQIRILNDTETLKFVIQKPRVFRTSPELMYALIRESNEKQRHDSPFICRNRIASRYGSTAEDLMKKHDVRERYSEDEYFDGR